MEPWLWSSGAAVLISLFLCIVPLVDPFSMGFNTFVDVVIIANVIVVAIEYGTDATSSFFPLADNVFTALFFIEVTIRMRAEGREYFYSLWNIFDLSLVGCGMYETWVVSAVVYFSPSSSLANGTGGALYMLTALRALRLLRLLRLLRPTGSLLAKEVDEEDDLGNGSEVWVTLPKNGQDPQKGSATP